MSRASADGGGDTEEDELDIEGGSDTEKGEKGVAETEDEEDDDKTGDTDCGPATFFSLQGTTKGNHGPTPSTGAPTTVQVCQI